MNKMNTGGLIGLLKAQEDVEAGETSAGALTAFNAALWRSRAESLRRASAAIDEVVADYETAGAETLACHVLVALTEADDWADTLQLAAACPTFKHQSVQAEAARLARAGLIWRIERGLYQLPVSRWVEP